MDEPLGGPLRALGVSDIGIDTAALAHGRKGVPAGLLADEKDAVEKAEKSAGDRVVSARPLLKRDSDVRNVLKHSSRARSRGHERGPLERDQAIDEHRFCALVSNAGAAEPPF